MDSGGIQLWQNKMNGVVNGVTTLCSDLNIKVQRLTSQLNTCQEQRNNDYLSHISLLLIGSVLTLIGLTYVYNLIIDLDDRALTQGHLDSSSHNSSFNNTFTKILYWFILIILVITFLIILFLIIPKFLTYKH